MAERREAARRMQRSQLARNAKKRRRDNAIRKENAFKQRLAAEYGRPPTNAELYMAFEEELCRQSITAEE